MTDGYIIKKKTACCVLGGEKNESKKERSWRWQTWLDGRVTPSFCRRGRRFV